MHVDIYLQIVTYKKKEKIGVHETVPALSLVATFWAPINALIRCKCRHQNQNKGNINSKSTLLMCNHNLELVDGIAINT